MNKDFFPVVNEKINYTGMSLMQYSAMFIAAIALKGKEKDSTTRAVKIRQEAAEAKKEAIAAMLKKYQITTLQVFKSDYQLKREFIKDCKDATAEFDQKNHRPLDQATIMINARMILKAKKNEELTTSKTH